MNQPEKRNERPTDESADQALPAEDATEDSAGQLERHKLADLIPATPEPEVEPQKTGARGRLGVKILVAILAIALIAAATGVGGFFYQRSQEEEHVQRAAGLAEEGAWSEALDAYTAALEVWPGAARMHDTESLLGRGECYLREGQYGEAIADLDAAWANDPNQVQVYRLRAEARWAQVA